MGEKIAEFNNFREKMNDIILKEGNLNTKRFFNLDNKIYQDGNLRAKTKELLGLTASLVLRCDDCITYHIIESYQAGWNKKEIYEAMNVALIVGGSIVIPHLRRAAELLEEIDSEENKEGENVDLDQGSFKIYTDGACRGNPGAGGYAAVILTDKGEKITEVSGREKDTTNNRMELKAVIEALKVIPAGSKLELFSDSSYVLKGLSSWIKSWKKNNWQTTSKNKVKNQDLWQKLDSLSSQFEIEFQKVKAHSGDHFNEKVDKLAKKEAEKF